MPKTRSEENSDSSGAASATATHITMSQEAFASFIASIQQTQNEFCQQLIQEVRSSTPHNSSEAQASLVFGGNGNFAKCTSRYGGRADESLDNFLDAVLTYKDCVNVSDVNALRGFSMLLEGPAAVWWQGVKQSTSTWSEAITRIKCAFGEHDPPHRLYPKFPSNDLSEKVQLDMTYGLLNKRIRKRVTRECVNSFDELLHKSRQVEDSVKEMHNKHTESNATSSSSPQDIPTVANVSSIKGRASSLESSAGASGGGAVAKSKKPFCSYCKRLGHAKDTCEKLKRASDKCDKSVNKEKSESELKCYGCGAANVIKSKCKNCSPQGQSSFYSLNISSHDGILSTSANSETAVSRAFARSRGCRHHRRRGSTAGAVPTPVAAQQSSSLVNPSMPVTTQGNPALAAEDFCNNNVCNLSNTNVNLNNCVSYDNNVNISECCFNNEQCFDYKNSVNVNISSSSFYDCNNDNSSENFNNCTPYRRPVLNINILGFCGTALVDTAAKTCIAGHTLYALLLRLGHQLLPSTQIVRRKECADKTKTPAEVFEVGDKVLLKSHVLSNAAKNITAKFVPKKDGPYVIVKRVSPTAYIVAGIDNPENVLGKYHVSDLTRFHNRESSPPRPVMPKRQRGRPRKHVCPVC
ncbi:hypothetical protein HF086_009190 [Spodoptera exigua]|uniref:Uncharacterized protein n=1 Tax=Spodoptera exigua TaxID=7107 RepID=A0A922SH42_SPOEX|nr:hypothetical protein HF086_009190 [Spodoptera exigua]